MSSQATTATLKISIGTNGFDTEPNFDEVASVWINHSLISTGITYDAEREQYGTGEWWTFSVYTVEQEINLIQGENCIEIVTYSYAFKDGLHSGGRNIDWIELTPTKHNAICSEIKTSRFQAEDAILSGGGKVEKCGELDDYCVGGLFQGSGGVIEYTIESNKETDAVLRLSIGKAGYSFWNALMSELQFEHTPHECRHTFRSRLDSSGANKVCIDLLMGHKSKEVGERVYTHKTIQELTDTINLLT